MLKYCFAQYSTLLLKKIIFTIYSFLAKKLRECVFFILGRDLCYANSFINSKRNRSPLTCIIFLFLCFTGLSQAFENVSIEFGINHSFSDNNEYGAGVSCVDFNLDGLDDITLPSVDSTIFFFQNTGDSFVKLNLIDRIFGEVKSVCWVDFDNDSDLDLSLTEFNGSLFLFENIGDLELIDITDNALLTNQSCHNFGHSWVDINQDGLLDVYLNRYFIAQDCTDYGSENLLFVNNGDNTFTERAEEFGISDGNKMSFQSSFYDYDKDGLLDLHVINDRFHENSLYRNSGLGYFEDVSEATSTNLIQDAMTNTIFDFNLDGYLDIYFTNTWPNGNHLLVYNPNSQSYEDQFPDFGAESYIFNWGAIPLDIDNDRFTDLAVSSGAGCGTGCSNLLYRNNGSSFIQVPNNFEEEESISYGVAKGDFNFDGFSDIVFLNESPLNTEVYINNLNNNNKWVKVNFSGACNNLFGVGVQYEYFIDGTITANTVFAGSNFLSQDSYTHILGMGGENSIDSISIHWTSGLTEKYYDINPFQTYSFKEGQTFNTSLSLLDTVFICSDEVIELESTTQYSNTLWNNGENTSLLTIDSPGVYYAYLEIEPGINICSDTLTVLLKPDIILDSITTQDPSCFGSQDGSAVVSHYDSLGNTTYSSYNNLTDGISTLPVLDNYLCSINVAVELFSPAPLLTEINVLSKPCDSLDVGSINISSFGGTAPYIYSIADSSSIAFGENTIVTLDSHGCSNSFDFYLDLSPSINIEFEITDQIGADLGSIEILNDSDITLVEIINSENEIQDPDFLSAGDYSLFYIDENGCEYTEEFTIEAINSIGESILGEAVEFFPNPCTQFLHIKNSRSNFEISIYSAQGKLLLNKYSTKLADNSIDLSILKCGVYFIKLNKDNQILTRKIIKI